jgi:hypothetical protein
MFARPVAIVCQLFIGAFFALTGSTLVLPRDVFIVLRHQNAISTNILHAIQQETGALFDSGSYRVQWLNHPQQVEAAFLVIAEFDGHCDVNSPASSPTIAKRLASAVVEDGSILPFVRVNCTALTELLSPALDRNPEAERLYGRALGRLLAHELYHVVGGAANHTGAGVAQSAFSRQDLLSADFRFDDDALRILHPPAPASASSRTALGVRKALTPLH